MSSYWELHAELREVCDKRRKTYEKIEEYRALKFKIAQYREETVEFGDEMKCCMDGLVSCFHSTSIERFQEYYNAFLGVYKLLTSNFTDCLNEIAGSGGIIDQLYDKIDYYDDRIRSLQYDIDNYEDE